MNNKLFWHIIGGCVTGLVALEVVAFQKPKLEMKWFHKGKAAALDEWHSKVFNSAYEHGHLAGVSAAMRYYALGLDVDKWLAAREGDKEFREELMRKFNEQEPDL